MTTVTTHDLMLALLAMDSYNRGGDNIVKQFITNANKEFSSQIAIRFTQFHLPSALHT